MAVDSTPATTVKNMLNGIDYSALIGGPLKAAIEAQAMAAKSSWEFIQEVGLYKDKDDVKRAVNVEFMYQKDGTLAKLIVPILTIVPIPMIVVDDVSIKFKASLNASASEYSENSSSQALDIGGEGSLTFGKGPVSVDLKIKANYSTKKDSKATQESKYSVEYTQDVEVHAKQADMPAGLATVLNILSSSVTPNGGAYGMKKLMQQVTMAINYGSGTNKNLKAYFGHLQVPMDDNATLDLEDGIDTLTFKANDSVDPAIITLTYNPSTPGSKPISTKIKVAKFTKPNSKQPPKPNP